MIPTGQDSLKTRSTLTVGGASFAYYDLGKAGAALGDISRLPYSMKVLLENLLRNWRDSPDHCFHIEERHPERGCSNIRAAC